MRERVPDWRDRMASWEDEEAGSQPNWVVMDTHIKLGSGEKYEVQPDKSILAEGYAPTRSVVSPEGKLESGTLNAFRLNS